MKFKRSILGLFLAALVIFAVILGVIRYAAYKNFPVVDGTVLDGTYGRITLARPLISFKTVAVVFADEKKFSAKALAKRIAKTGAAVAVFNQERAIKALTDAKTHCLDPSGIMAPLAIVTKWAHAPKGTFSILAGIGDGALLPFVAASTRSDGASMNLSVNFSVDLPDKTAVCSPLADKTADGHRRLTASPDLQGKWLAAWTDQPDDDTAIFIRGIKGAETDITPYDTPLDTVVVNEIRKITDDQLSSVPTVALPAGKPNPTVTFFYSGDGGWRDLDRDVGGIMAKRGYPVVGVDTLRYFWSSKKVERVAEDLSKLMKRYRTAWKAKHFVLAGYSFGADILPAVYNHLPEADKKDVKLLILLALGKSADFEIHVSGWIGKSSSGFPILPELRKIPGNKILCIYGKEEKDDSACTELTAPDARVVELPGGHHFDHDYPKLAMRLIDVYRQTGMTRTR